MFCSALIFLILSAKTYGDFHTHCPWDDVFFLVPNPIAPNGCIFLALEASQHVHRAVLPWFAHTLTTLRQNVRFNLL